MKSIWNDGAVSKMRHQGACHRDSRCVIAVHFHHTEQVKGSPQKRRRYNGHVLPSGRAPWIWDRLEWVIKRLGLREAQVSLGLDWCHAVHHISLALEPLLKDAERKRVFKKLRKWLKQGRWQQVVNELYKLLVLAELSDESAVLTAISYLERHGEEGHLAYARFRRRKLPLGSGAIESAVRRVINLRMKGNC